MSEVLNTLIGLTVSASLLAGVLLIIKSVTKKRLPKIWQYYIWLLVIVKFLVPVTPMVNLAEAFSGYGFEMPRFVNGIRPPQNKGVQDLEALPGGHAILPDEDMTAETQPVFDQYAAQWLFVVWLGVGMALLFRKTAGYLAFVRQINANSVVCMDGSIKEHFDLAAGDLKITRLPALKIHPSIGTPMLVGIWKPVVLLPEALADTPGLKYIFMHELIHYKSLDFLYKWFVQIVVCIHWFNPFAYIVQKEINRSCELSCDERVMAHLGQPEKMAYGNMLMQSLFLLRSMDKRDEKKPAALALTEGTKMMAERFNAIKAYKRKSKAILIFTVVFTLVLAGCTAFAGVSFTAFRGASPLRRLAQRAESAPVQQQTVTGGRGSIVYDNVEIRYYDYKSKPYPYIHDSITNHLSQAVTVNAWGMLAFDRDGQPLKLKWNGFSDSAPAYLYICDWGDATIATDTTLDEYGGWSLFEGNPFDPIVPDISYEVAYVLYNFKTLTLADGTVWENPGFDQWLADYEGKAVDVSILQNYYPYEIEITH